MTGLDLSGAAEALAEWIVDDVQIVRDNGPVDDELDEETGDLTPTEAKVIYAGVGMVQAAGDAYRLLLPLDVEAPTVAGDQVRVSAVHGFTAVPDLTTRQFKVTGPPDVGSLMVAEVIGLEEVRPVDGLFPDPTP